MASAPSGRTVRRAIPLFVAARLLAGAPQAFAAPEGADAAVIVPEGTRRPGDLTALGRRVEIRGDVEGAVVSTLGDVLVTGRVAGPVVTIGGDVVLAGSGRVQGDVLAVGGAVRLDGAASARAVGGRIRSLGALEAAFLSELRTSPLAGAAVSPLLVSFRLFLLCLWLAVALLLLRTAPRALGTAAAGVSGRLVLLAALFLASGRRLLRGARRGGALFGDPAAMAVGLLVLGLPSLVPAAGPLYWALVSVVAIGLAVRTIALREPRATRAPLAGEAA